MDKDLALYGRGKPIMAYQAEGGRIWLWPGAGPVVAIDASSGDVLERSADPGDSPYAAIAASGPNVASIQENRLLRIISASKVKERGVFLPEPFAHDVCLTSDPLAQGGFIARTSSISARWDPASGEL
jgi:hypothetical protein